MRDIYLKLLPICLITWGISGCEKIEIPKPLAPIVETYVIPKNNNENLQHFPALIKASDYTSLSFRVSGEIVSVLVTSGSKVKKGEKIATLDDSDFILDVDNKRVKTEFSKVSMERAKKMVALNNMAQSTLDQLEAEYRIALTSYQLAQTKLNYTTLYAPFDGIIASIPTESFQNIQTGEQFTTMQRTDKLQVNIELPDVILAQASAKATAERASKRLFKVTLDAYPDHTFTAYYQEHTLEQNNDSKSYQLILEIKQEEDKTILPGMPGSVSLDLSIFQPKLKVNKVPLAALVSMDDKDISKPQKIVWRMTEEQTVEPVEVLIGQFTENSLVEVTGDLKPGDTIAVSGLLYLKENTQVILADSKEIK